MFIPVNKPIAIQSNPFCSHVLNWVYHGISTVYPIYHWVALETTPQRDIPQGQYEQRAGSEG